MAEALAALSDLVPPMRLQVNNRKLIQGFYQGIGAQDVDAVMRVIDKIDKVPADVVGRMLVERGRAHRGPGRASACGSPEIRSTDTSFVDRVRALGVDNELLEQGLRELAAVVEGCADVTSERFAVEADLRIARGLDYYTGTVFETVMAGFESLGLDLLGRPLRRAGQRRPGDLPRRGHLARRDPDAGAAASRAAGSPPPAAVPSAVLVALVDEETRAAGRRGRPAAARPRRRHRGGARRRRSSASRSGTPSAAASRSSGSPPAPTSRTRSRTSAAASSTTPTVTSWTPPEADLAPTVSRHHRRARRRDRATS